MTFLESRQVFSLKTDHPVRRLRHDILVRHGLIYRYSLLASHDEGIHIEAQVIDRVLEQGIPAIPVASHQDTHTYQVMRRARGTAVADLPIEERRVAWLQLAAELRKLHTIGGTGAGLIVKTEPLTGAYSTWELYVKHYIVEHGLYCLEHGLLDEQTVKAVFAPFITWQQEPFVTTGSLLHGDLNDYNVFWDGKRLEIIDWEDALIGDPIFDLAGWGCFTGHPKEEWAAFLEAYYGGAVPNGFWPLFNLYMLRIALSRLVYLHRYAYPDLELGKARVLDAVKALS